MRLAGAIIITLLVTTIAVFLISVPAAAAPMDHRHHSVHGEAIQASTACHDSPAGSGCGEHAGGTHEQGNSCCGSVSCHSFQVSTAPAPYSPVASALRLAIVGDEQVAGIVPGRLDRPPRIV